MLPNIAPPVDRSEEAMQGIMRRAPAQAFHGHVGASNLPCSICMAGCSLLPFGAKQLCEAACNATVC